MPDICMCIGKGCPLKNNCYRYRAKPDCLGQIFFSVPPYKDGECDRFWDCTGRMKLRGIDEIEQNPLE